MCPVAASSPLVFDTMAARNVEQYRAIQVSADLAKQPAAVTLVNSLVVYNHQPHTGKLQEKVKHFATIKVAFQSPWRFHRRIDDTGQVVVIRQKRHNEIIGM